MNDLYQTSGTSPTAADSCLAPPDICLDNHGSIYLLRPVTSAGQRWLRENVIGPETQVFGNAVVCEPRYVLDIVLGARGEGIVVR